MIDLRFGLFWAGHRLPYFRYLTFKSLRKCHPDASIQLYVSKDWANDGYAWRDEAQDFENPCSDNNYMPLMEDLNVEVIETDQFSKYTPNYQSDFFRWWWIKENGGFYLDTDQIILRSFETLDRDYDFIYSAYQAPSCGIYTPVGVIGGTKSSEIIDWINALLPQYYDPNSYNSLGPFMLRSVIASRKWKDRMYNTPSDMFYPLMDSWMVKILYGQEADGMSALMGHMKDSYALHWFGGHPLSQKFNKDYTEEKAQTSFDVISCILRDRQIV